MAKLSAVAQRRIQVEMKEWMESPPEGCLLEEGDSLHEWTVHMLGPAPLYEGEYFTLRIKFGEHYPLCPPDVTFGPPAPVHPHIYSNGHICLNILYAGENGGWSPALTVYKVAMSLRSMLASATEKTAPPGEASYVRRVGNASPQLTQWQFEDDTV